MNLLNGRSLIADLPPAPSRDTFRAVNPATGERLAPDYHEASADVVDMACRQAETAFRSYRHASGADRANFLDRIADEIERIGEPLANRFVAETGLTATRAQSETARTCAQLRMFAALVKEGSWVDARIDRALPTRAPLPRPDLRSMLRPLGPIAVFGPANFPLAFDAAGGDTASALAAGCPVVVKAHSSHPGTAELVGHAIRRAGQALGLPAGIFSLIYGKGAVVGSALAAHPGIKGVGFTGSQRVGLQLQEICHRRSEPIPFFGELSSLNPVYLLPAALAERPQAIAEGLHASLTLGNGQFCTNPGLIFYSEGTGADTFVGSLTRLLRATAPAPMLSLATARSYRHAIAHLSAQPGLHLLTADFGMESEQHAIVTPTLFKTTAAHFIANGNLQEEMFGPASLLVSCSHVEEMIRAANVLNGQLTATFHEAGDDLERAAALVDHATHRSGRVIFNGYPTGVEVCAAMVHGGPWPATTDSRFTSVGTAAIRRWVKPVCWQNSPASMLPAELRDYNPLRLTRTIDGVVTAPPVTTDS